MTARAKTSPLARRRALAATLALGALFLCAMREADAMPPAKAISPAAAQADVLTREGSGPVVAGVGETLSAVVLSARRLPEAELRRTRPALAAALAPGEGLEVVQAQVVRGALTGETVTVERLASVQTPPLPRGARVTLEYELSPDGPARLYLSDFERLPALLLLAGLTLAGALLVGGAGALWRLGGAAALALFARTCLLPAAHGGVWTAISAAALALALALWALLAFNGWSGRPRRAFLAGALGGSAAGALALGLLMRAGPVDGALMETMAGWPLARMQAGYWLSGMCMVAAAALPAACAHTAQLSQTLPEKFGAAMALGRASMWCALGVILLAFVGLWLCFYPLWMEIPDSRLFNQENIVGWIGWGLAAALAALASPPATAAGWHGAWLRSASSPVAQTGEVPAS